MQKGLWLALATVVLWAADNVYMRLAATYWDVQPLVFSVFMSFMAAVTLLVIAGPGKLGVETLRQPHTWAYSVIVICINIALLYAFKYFTATQTTLLIRFSVVLSLIVAWMFFARRPGRHDAIGTLVTLAGCGIIIVALPAEMRPLAMFFMVLLSLILTLKTVVTETHPTSNKAETIKQRCRTTGYVLLVTSFSFLLLSLMGAAAKDSMAGLDAESFLARSLPSLADFAHAPTVFSALLGGMLIIAAATYSYFYSTRLIKSETFLMVSTLVPVFTYAMEWALSLTGLLEVTTLSTPDLLAGALIVGAAMYMVGMRGIK